jgi:phenylalanyl-tRNA synthetase beta subunit
LHPRFIEELGLRHAVALLEIDVEALMPAEVTSSQA